VVDHLVRRGGAGRTSARIRRLREPTAAARSA
jgi:hypothetical protein